MRTATKEDPILHEGKNNGTSSVAGVLPGTAAADIHRPRVAHLCGSLDDDKRGI
ncbi:MAG: hypothetical protein V4819_15840 [Verrucomicrobiota bacterium]